MNEKTFRPENLKKKGIFRKWAVFPHFLCRLHRNRTKNVGNAPLAEPAFFSYTFNRKVKEQQRHRLCPGAGLGEGELLQQHQNDLTKSGHMVADYLVQHAAEAQYLSISSLARECKVAEATVFRFCRALGFEGYHEMRIALAQANATGVLVNQQAPSPDADTTTLCEHASALFMTAINGTQNALSTEAVDEAVHLMQEARQVFCLGQGGSMLLANDICARFASLSTKFRTAGDSHLQLLTASLMNEADVVLFISYSGATRDMMETLRTAKAAGAKIILLTHYEDSPGALLADVVLLCGAQESPLDSGSIPIKAAFLYVGEVLVLRYMLDDPAHSNTAQDLTSEAMTVKML